MLHKMNDEMYAMWNCFWYCMSDFIHIMPRLWNCIFLMWCFGEIHDLMRLYTNELINHGDELVLLIDVWMVLWGVINYIFVFISNPWFLVEFYDVTTIIFQTNP